MEDLGWLMLPRVLRSGRAEEEEAVGMEGCVARADRRAGEGIAMPVSQCGFVFWRI